MNWDLLAPRTCRPLYRVQARDWLLGKLHAESDRKRSVGQLGVWRVFGAANIFLALALFWQEALPLAAAASKSGSLEIHQILRTYEHANRTAQFDSVWFGVHHHDFVEPTVRRTGERVSDCLPPDAPGGQLGIGARVPITILHYRHHMPSCHPHLHGKEGPVWALSAELLSTGTAAAN